MKSCFVHLSMIRGVFFGLRSGHDPDGATPGRVFNVI